MFRNHITLVTVAGIFALGIVGCGESQDPIRQYGNEVIHARERTERVKARADVHVLKTAIQQYYTERGRYPETLSALPLVQNQGIDTDVYVYDPATGSLQLR